MQINRVECFPLALVGWGAAVAVRERESILTLPCGLTPFRPYQVKGQGGGDGIYCYIRGSTDLDKIISQSGVFIIMHLLNALPAGAFHRAV